MYRISEMAEQMNEILSSHRKVADEAVMDVMLDAFREVGALLAETEEAEGVVLEFDKGAGAFKPADLENALVHWRKQDLVEWFIGLSELERTTLIMRFLDYDRMRAQEFRARYPKAFMKWSAEEDAELAAMYKGQYPWREMSAHFGRNTNALKLRLERLGFDLGANGGRSRFHPRPLPGAGSTGGNGIGDSVFSGSDGSFGIGGSKFSGSDFDNGVQEIKPPEETGIAGPTSGSPQADIFPPPLSWDED